MESHHVRLAVRRGRAETYRAENACQEGYVVIHHLVFLELAHLGQLLYHEYSQDVGLTLLYRAVGSTQSLAGCAFSVQRILHTESVRYLMEHGIFKEGWEFHMLPLFGYYQQVSYRFHYAVELVLHRIP